MYGTLLSGQSNWFMLEPWVADSGEPDTVAGALYDTGLGWPAAVFGPGAGRVVGHVFTLAADTLDEALAVLDGFEGIHEGAYSRIEVVTDGGRTAWAYHSGEPGDSPQITSGDWTAHTSST